MGGTYPGWGGTYRKGVPTLDGGYLPWTGGGYLSWIGRGGVVPTLDSLDRLLCRRRTASCGFPQEDFLILKMFTLFQDFEGQRRAERTFQVIIVLFAVSTEELIS